MRIEKEKEFWDKLSPKYDRFIEKNWRVYALLLDKISSDVDSGNTVLDVATGTGLVALRVAQQSKQVYAMDISPPMIDEAKKKMKQMGIGNIEFSVDDAYSLPFDNDMFDAAICNNALHNMKYPRRALSEMRKVLKPGGRLIAIIVGIGESHRYKIMMTIYNLLVKLPVFHKLNLDEAANMITESGFIIVKKEIIKHTKDALPLLYIVAE